MCQRLVVKWNSFHTSREDECEVTSWPSYLQAFKIILLFLFREIFPMTTNRNSKALVFSQLCWSCVNFSVCFHELFLGCPSSRAQYQVRWRGWQPSCRDETTSKKWTAHSRDSCTRGHRWRRWVAGRCYKCWGPIDMETGPVSVWRMTWL